MPRISSGILFALLIVSIGGCRRQPGLRPAVIPADSVSDGYGTKSRDQAGGVQSVTVAERSNIKVTRVEELLEGLPGLNVQRTGNGGYSVTMRGVGSFMSSEQALFVIDGVPYQGGLGWLNPADVVRIDLLKNPSETAIYGVRGANGIVVITTKRKP